MATRETRTLDRLPSELIVQIASTTTPETVLALAQVSRSLHETCYDSLVFLEAFYDRRWAQRYFGHEVKNTDLIARYAVAESRYLQFLENGKNLAKWEAEVIPTNSELLKYLPNLALSCNPVPGLDHSFLLGRRLGFKNGSPPTIETELMELVNLGDELPAISISFAYGLLKGAPFAPSSLSLAQELKDHSQITFHSHVNLRDGVREEAASHPARFHTDCLIGVGKMATLLSCGYPNREQNPNLSNNYLTAGQRHSTHVDVPSVSKIPITKTPFDIPKPFLAVHDAVKSWKDWLQWQRRMRSTPEYMDAGEWVGMYAYNNSFRFGLAGNAFDPPMTGIRFRTQGPLTSAGGYLSLASGIDGIGEFDLTLSMNGDGYIQGRKSYRQQNTTWSWYLSNTPFGLYGLWVSERGVVGDVGDLGGALWLWKREWCE